LIGDSFCCIGSIGAGLTLDAETSQYLANKFGRFLVRGKEKRTKGHPVQTRAVE